MGQVKIFWDPIGVSVDTIGRKRFIRITDGDTPYIQMSIRMLNIDTPELHYPSNSNPSRQDAPLKQLATWIGEGKAPINDDLGNFLAPKIATGDAGTRQKQQGEQARNEFQKLLDEKLDRGGSTKRPLFIRAADEHFDQYGRLLAFIAPNYTQAERESMTRRERATFNLLMIESGWASTFPIYPSIPSHPDLELLQRVAKDAYDNGRGAWADANVLTGYEFRMCVKLHGITKKIVNGRKLTRAEKYGWISRYCVDMTTREIFYPQDYFKVKPYNRIFVWPEDIVEAVARMNLVPPE